MRTVSSRMTRHAFAEFVCKKSAAGVPFVKAQAGGSGGVVAAAASGFGGGGGGVASGGPSHAERPRGRCVIGSGVKPAPQCSVRIVEAASGRNVQTG